jgi:murein DD-endopeptidase MepM/ murein hydrolase activator NlpD
VNINEHSLPSADGNATEAPLFKQNLTQNRILSQNAYKAEHKLARRFKLRWVLAVSCIPLFGIYTAFGIAPQTSLNQVDTETIIEQIALPEITETFTDLSNNIEASNYWYKEIIRRDDTLYTVLSRLNIGNREAVDFIRSDSIASEIASKLKPGRQIDAQTDIDGNLISLSYQLSSTEFIDVSFGENGYIAEKSMRNLDTRAVLKSAEIKHSLFGATDAAGIPDSIAIQLAEVFESDIDFRTDLRRGDKFNVIYEGGYSNGELLNVGQVLAAEFINNGKIYRAIGFKDDNGKMNYYTPDGRSLHKSFLRSPLEFTRISSGFTMGRFHPVLQKMRAHKGVDMAAPTGTKIKAAGDSVVEFVGVKGGYGNVVILKHANNVKTVYGHMSRFAPGLKRGAKISQGQLIGFVGMTGMATGPHLHYEFMQNGQHKDPMKVALPKANPLPANQKAAFDQLTAQMSNQLNLLANSNIAALD